jgi:hypothetical protein
MSETVEQISIKLVLWDLTLNVCEFVSSLFNITHALHEPHIDIYRFFRLVHILL